MTTPIVNQDGVLGFRLSQFVPEEWTFKMSGAFYGPGAREIGFGFSMDDGRGATIAAVAGSR